MIKYGKFLKNVLNEMKKDGTSQGKILSAIRENQDNYSEQIEKSLSSGNKKEIKEIKERQREYRILKKAILDPKRVETLVKIEESYDNELCYAAATELVAFAYALRLINRQEKKTEFDIWEEYVEKGNRRHVAKFYGEAGLTNYHLNLLKSLKTGRNVMDIFLKNQATIDKNIMAVIEKKNEEIRRLRSLPGFEDKDFLDINAESGDDEEKTLGDKMLGSIKILTNSFASSSSNFRMGAECCIPADCIVGLESKYKSLKEDYKGCYDEFKKFTEAFEEKLRTFCGEMDDKRSGLEENRRKHVEKAIEDVRNTITAELDARKDAGKKKIQHKIDKKKIMGMLSENKKAIYTIFSKLKKWVKANPEIKCNEIACGNNEEKLEEEKKKLIETKCKELTKIFDEEKGKIKDWNVKSVIKKFKAKEVIENLRNDK